MGFFKKSFFLVLFAFFVFASRNGNCTQIDVDATGIPIARALVEGKEVSVEDVKSFLDFVLETYSDAFLSTYKEFSLYDVLLEAGDIDGTPEQERAISAFSKEVTSTQPIAAGMALSLVKRFIENGF